MSDELLVAIESSVALMTFNRPGALNALNEAAIVAFRQACAAVEHDPGIRCVVLRGAGPAFLSGGDVALFAERMDELPQVSERLTAELHEAILALRRMGKPVVASVHGAVAGAGISIMAACDVVLAADDARFVPGYASIGTSPDGGSTFFLARCLGPRRALEFMLMAEPIGADRALTLGLIDRIVPRDELGAATQIVVERLANGPTMAYAHTKRLVESAGSNSLGDHLAAEARAFVSCAASEDMREGIRAFIEKRKPKFRGC